LQAALVSEFASKPSTSTLAGSEFRRFSAVRGTRKRKDGTTEWIPPPHLDRGQRRTNNYFRPERMLDEDDDQPE
jgi:hypothetical protein